MTTASPTVICISGLGRSGSTLLERLLIERTRAFGVGELRYLWERGLVNNERCGCGVAFADCPFWTQVVPADRTPGELAELAAMVGRHNRTRRLPAQLVPRLRSGAFAETTRRYQHEVVAVLRRVAHVASTDLVVDSSKIPTHALALAELDDVRLVVVHLVRDSRAVAHSFQRLRARPEVHQTEAFMDQPAPANTALTWDSQNAALQVLGRRHPGYVRVRYEDVVADPDGAVDQVIAACRRVGHVGDVTPTDDDPLARWHSVAGNPMRFTPGPVTLRLDVEWRDRMARRHRLLVTALTLPLLAHYGYKLR